MITDGRWGTDRGASFMPLLTRWQEYEPCPGRIPEEMTVIAAPERWRVARGGIRDSWALAKEDGREAVMSLEPGRQASERHVEVDAAGGYESLARQ